MEEHEAIVSRLNKLSSLKNATNDAVVKRYIDIAFSTLNLAAGFYERAAEIEDLNKISGLSESISQTVMDLERI